MTQVDTRVHGIKFVTVRTRIGDLWDIFLQHIVAVKRNAEEPAVRGETPPHSADVHLVSGNILPLDVENTRKLDYFLHVFANDRDGF